MNDLRELAALSILAREIILELVFSADSEEVLLGAVEFIVKFPE
jgi:hypothetical protein